MPSASNSLSPVNSKTTFAEIRYLLFFSILVVVLAAIAAAYIEVKDIAHWMVAMSIALMSIFLPLTAISFLSYRLPQKQKEFLKIIDALEEDIDSNGDLGERASFVLSADFRGIDYLLPVIFNTLFSVLGFYILFANDGLVLFHAMEWVDQGIGRTTDNLQNFAYNDFRVYRQGLVALGFAFLGAYIWSVQYIFKRMVTLDLPPGAYYSVGTRLIYSSFLALLFSHLTYWGGSVENSDQFFNLHQQLPIAAFLTGIFPERTLNWMRESLGSVFGRRDDYANALPLEMIEGIGSYHKARLAELGVDNVQNLAHSSLVELIVKTPYKPRVLADWMAQARLCLEFKEHTGEIRRAGIRTILDLQDVYRDKQSFAALAQESGVSLNIIETVYSANANEAAIDRLRQAYDRLSVV